MKTEPKLEPNIFNSDHYHITQGGEVISLYYKQSRAKTLTYRPKEMVVDLSNKNGYKMIKLVDNDGERVQYSIHRLLAEAYIPNPNGYGVVKHKDSDKMNNAISNLEWTNMKDALNNSVANGMSDHVVHGKWGIENGRAKSVMCVETGEVWDTARLAATAMGVDYSSISKVCRGLANKVGGHTYKFVTA